MARADEQAFPIPGDEESVRRLGMTMREWFAGQALIGLLGSRNPVAATIAADAFLMADAMIAQAALNVDQERSSPPQAR